MKLFRKEHMQTLKSIVLTNTSQFAESTTIHGVKYFADKQLYPLERLYFVSAFVAFVSCTCYFTYNVLEKWQHMPVRFSLNPQQSYMSHDPFPSITICNANIAYKSKVSHFTNDSAEHGFLQMLCNRRSNMQLPETWRNYTFVNNFVKSIGQPCDKMVIACKFGGKIYNCSDIIETTITDAGLCCTFNAVSPAFIYHSHIYKYNKNVMSSRIENVFWSVESGYPKNLSEQFIPFKAAGKGQSLGLKLLLNVEADEYYCSTTNTVGFRFTIDSPSEMNTARESSIPLAPGWETAFRIKVKKHRSEAALYHMNRPMRRCIFEDEQPLYFYRKYTEENCEVEYSINQTLNICGCIAHFMPTARLDVPVCLPHEFQCIERTYFRRLLPYGSNNTEEEEMCFPNCFDIAFSGETFSAPLGHPRVQVYSATVSNRSYDYMQKNIAVLRVYYERPSYRGYLQTEYASNADLMSRVGALIGLFFGFSFISIAEFLYFAIIRPLRRFIRHVFDKTSIQNITSAVWKKPIRRRYRETSDYLNKTPNLFNTQTVRNNAM